VLPYPRNVDRLVQPFQAHELRRRSKLDTNVRAVSWVLRAALLALLLLLASPESGLGVSDTTPPTVTPPLPQFTVSSILGKSTIPLKEKWSGSDAGSGVCSYDARESVDGQPYAQLTLGTGAPTSVTRQLQPGSDTYQYEVRGTDCANNTSAFSVGPLFSLGAVQESSSSIGYTGTWTTSADDSAYGFSLASATAAGASASYTFSGRNVAWVAPRGPDRGQAQVFIDGKLISTVDLYKASSQPRRVVFAKAWSAIGTHTIKVVVVGTAGRPRVDIDAFATVGAATVSNSVSFSKSQLAGTSSTNITSLQFGPDGRLYVANQNGLIKAYTIARTGPGAYSVTATETINLIQNIPNHNDDGTLAPSVTTRQVTGILVTGTSANPVIYVTSSDPRIGGGSSGTDTGLDTNSGVLSRLTWSGSAWTRTDLVRGLPRSEENHSSNGLALNTATNTLYIAQGGNTNKGAPANNFAFLPEVALSAAILSVNLTAIGNTTYDLPTLNDDSRPGNPDPGDPFGGDNGKNQAVIVPGGPVQVYAPGFRNPYDVVITTSGRMYTIDNGANAGWGDIPVGEGPGGTCTNAVNEPGTTDPDTLHFITGQGYYGGHPNPTRGNTSNVFNSDGISSVPTANPIECDYLAPGTESLTTFPESTNGLTQYTAGAFGGAMTGDLLAVSFDNSLYRIKLNSAGTQVVLKQALFQNIDSLPLDVTTQGDSGAFPGTIWVGDHTTSNITVFEPTSGGCTGAYSQTLDEDGDGYTNADEIDNHTDPCSAADVPPDHDGDHISDLNDPDDDNDGIPDTSDKFAWDAQNGLSTTLPVSYTWDNDASLPGGLMNLGFTGLMTNGSANYATLFNPANMTAGGAAGVTTIDKVPAGTATGATNTQKYGFDFGVQVPQQTFTAHTRIVAPFAGITPAGSESMGLFIGTGDQDNYLKLVTSANKGAGGIQMVREINGTVTNRPQAAVAMPGPNSVDLYLTINPATDQVQASYAVTTGGVLGARTNLGTPISVPAAWLNGSSALAVGMISTSAGGTPFPATWDLIEAVNGTG
jgi:hypothetical protein